jgi:Bacterial PH domain
VWCTGKNFTKIDFAAGQVDIFGIQQYLNSKINWLGAQGSQDYVHGEPLSENKPSSFGKLMDWLGDNAQQLSPAAVEQQFKKDAPVLMENEKVHLAFRSGRDLTVFTDLRYLTIDKQGVFGKKVVFESFPWRSFAGFSVETAGAYFDRDTEIHLYTNIAAYCVLHQDFRNGAADVFAIQKHLANKILGEDVTHLPGLDLKQGHIDPKTSWWFRDNQRPLDATEMDKYYHETVPLLQGSEHVELAFKGR